LPDSSHQSPQIIAMTLGQIHREPVNRSGFAGMYARPHVGIIAGIASQPSWLLKASLKNSL
jgi:hypothetical protein